MNVDAARVHCVRRSGVHRFGFASGIGSALLLGLLLLDCRDQQQTGDESGADSRGQVGAQIGGHSGSGSADAPFDCTEANLLLDRLDPKAQTYSVTGTFVFNRPVDRKGFERRFSLNLARRGALKFTIEEAGNPEVVSFHSEAIQAEEQAETLVASLRPGLAAERKAGALRGAIVRSLEIPPLLRLSVEGVSFAVIEREPRLRLQFSRPVSIENVRASLSVTPAVPGLELLGDERAVFVRGSFEPERRYSIQVGADLVSIDGFPMSRAFDGSAFLGLFPPTIEIQGEGNILCLRGEGKLAVRTRNIDRIRFRVERIYSNNLVQFMQESSLQGLEHDRWYNIDRTGSSVCEGRLPVTAAARNQSVMTAFSLAAMLSDSLAGAIDGVFRVTVAGDGDDQPSDSRGIVITDLGILAKQGADSLTVAVVSIRDLKPLRGVSVSLLSYNNQSLAAGTTGAEGTVRLPAPAQGEYGLRPYLITAARKSDLAFLALSEAFSDRRPVTGDLGLGGDPYPGKGYQAFLYTDRDLFRPGDRAHVAWIIRDGQFQPPESFPLRLRIRGPDGRVFWDERVTSGESGTGEASIPVPDFARTGVYEIALVLDEARALGSTSVRVEEFIPDRMKVECQVLSHGRPVGQESAPLASSETLDVRAHALMLFGPPAAARTARGEARFTPTAAHFDAYEGFAFGTPVESDLPPVPLGDVQTDSVGRASWRLPLPAAAGLQCWLKTRIEVEVAELGGGRVVRDARELIVSPAERMMGLRRLDADDRDYRTAGAPISFEAVMVNMDGSPVAADSVHLRVFEIRWRTVVRRDPDGRYRYVSESEERPVLERWMPLERGATRFAVSVPEHGSYRVDLANRETRATLPFYVYGWGYAPWAMSTPEKVAIRLDKSAYRPGEEIHVQIEAPFSGLLWLSVETDRVLHREWVRMQSNSASVVLHMPEGASPNAYVVATLLRPLESLELHAPARAVGAIALSLDRETHSLQVEARITEPLRPRETMTVGFRVPGLQPGSSARVTIAAVDEGILQVSNFRTPSPLDFFFRRRRWSVANLDSWRLLLPEYEQVLKTSASGGDDGGEAIRQRNLNPVSVRRVEPVSLWSGMIEGGSDWREARFDLPEWNGALRVMVVASCGDRFGSAEKRVRVHDNLVLNPNLPRFLAPGDTIDVPVSVYRGGSGADSTHGSRGDGAAVPIAVSTSTRTAVQVALRLSGPIEAVPATSLRDTLGLSTGEEGIAWFRIRATDAIGKAEIIFTATTGSDSTRASTTLGVRPPQPLLTEVRSGSVRSDLPTQYRFRSTWIPGTSRGAVTVSSLPSAMFGAALPYLLRYPYGCAEQVTSRCIPLLYFSDLARRLSPEQFGANDADYFVQEGIQRLLSLQTESGGFVLWPDQAVEHPDPWLSAYVTHFLVEAAQAGHDVPAGALQNAAGELKRIARQPERYFSAHTCSDAERIRATSYVLYVLALYGEPEHGVMDALRERDLPAMGAVQRTLLGGAYALCGDTATMDALLPPGPSPEADFSLGYGWRSPASDEAIQLVVLASAAPGNGRIPELLTRLGRRAADNGGRWRNTQENGLALLGLGKLLRQKAADPASGEILVDGVKIADFTPRDTVLTSSDWAGREVEIRVHAAGTAYFSVLDEGIPARAAAGDSDAGVTVRREYFDERGTAVSLKNIHHGDLLICRLTAFSQKGEIRDAVIADLVPAGLEIENPRLTDRETPNNRFVAPISPLQVEHLDIRDDRLLLFTSIGTEPRVFRYALRAVTAGSFVLPPVKAQAMYDPDIRSTRGSGRITVLR